MIGQQEVGNVNIQSEQSRTIEQVINCLKSFERPAVTCGLLVSPVGKDVAESFEWPVVDRWRAESYSSDLVTVEVIVEADGDTGREQYKSVTSSLTECADLLNLSGGVDVIHFLIEMLFADMEQLAVAKQRALYDSVVSEVTGPRLFSHLPTALEKAIVSQNDLEGERFHLGDDGTIVGSTEKDWKQLRKNNGHTLQSAGIKNNESVERRC